MSTTRKIYENRQYAIPGTGISSISKVNTTALSPPTLHAEDDSYRDKETGSRSAPASCLPKLACQDFQGICQSGRRSGIHSKPQFTRIPI